MMDVAHLMKDAETRVPYSAGSTIFSAGDRGDYLYVVMEGEVDIMSGAELIRTVTVGDIFGEMSLIDDSPRSADAVARTDCVLAAVDERHFLFLIHQTPMFAVHVMSIMAQRLRGHVP